MTDQIVPDSKDWTWVLEAPCPDCRFEAARHDPTQTGAAVRSNATEWQSILVGHGVTERPDPATWSPLEYACHVRDVFRLADHRLDRMLTEDDPLFANWDQDVTAIEDRYGEQDPAVVSAELVDAAAAVAARFDAVADDQWTRPGRRSDGAAFTVASFARYILHDPVHHVWDVRRADASSS